LLSVRDGLFWWSFSRTTAPSLLPARSLRFLFNTRSNWAGATRRRQREWSRCVALLKDAITTPAGCAIDGDLEFEEGGLRVALVKAVMRATERVR
jgi:hypothetical protein